MVPLVLHHIEVVRICATGQVLIVKAGLVPIRAEELLSLCPVFSNTCGVWGDLASLNIQPAR